MRPWLLRLHLYGGLLCAPYLIIFGLSSLQYQHHFEFVGRTSEPTTWEVEGPVLAQTDLNAWAEAVRESLDLAGYINPRQTNVNADGNLRFVVDRPGRNYRIEASVTGQKIRVAERRKSIAQIITSLHALHNVPGSSAVFWWAIYTEICAVFGLFAAVSGFWLWLTTRRDRRSGWVIFGAAAVVCVAVMLGVVTS